MRWRTLALAATVAIGLAACNPIIVRGDGTITSHATWRVVPTTVTVEGVATPAMEVRMRDCHTVRYVDPPTSSPVPDAHLRPVATVTAADGTVLFANFSYGPGFFVSPPGASVTDGGSADAHRIVVPVAGAATPITVSAGCTTYPGVGSIPNPPTWRFPTCVTTDRTCAATAPGTGTWN